MYSIINFFVASCADFTKQFLSILNSSRWILIDSSFRARASCCFTLFVVIFSTLSDLSLASASFYFVLHATRISAWINLSFASVENDSSFAATYFSSKSKSCTLAFSAFFFQSMCLLSLIGITPPFQYFHAKNVSSLRLILMATHCVGVSPLQVLCEVLWFSTLVPLLVLHVSPLDYSAYYSTLLVYDTILDVCPLIVWLISL